MNQDEIMLILHRTVSSLQLINDSQALQEIAEMPHAHPEIALIAINCLDAVIQLRLRIQQTIDAQIKAELDGIFEEAA